MIQPTDTITSVLSAGMQGEPLPYLLSADPMMTITLFMCFILMSFVIFRGYRYIHKEAKDIFLNRDRGSLFDEVSSADGRILVLLVLHACLMWGICGYRYLIDTTPQLLEVYPRLWLLASCSISVILYIIFKLLAYGVVNSVFFQKDRNKRWIKAFVNLHIGAGMLLFPLVLLIVYFNLPSSTTALSLLIVLFLVKISLLFKCFSNFFEKIYGAFHLILYFCTLEIIPDLLLWKGIEIISNNLIFKL